MSLLSPTEYGAAAADVEGKLKRLHVAEIELLEIITVVNRQTNPDPVVIDKLSKLFETVRDLSAAGRKLSVIGRRASLHIVH